MPNKFPIILAHGIARFDELRQRTLALFASLGIVAPPTFDLAHYFKGIASHLIHQGFDVHHSSVEFAAGVETRAAQLSTEVERILSETNKKKAHIIGHSMGGLDARRMIVEHDMAKRVASLTTIGTPHNGTCLADWGIESFGNRLIAALRPIVHIEGFADLTIARCQQFNAEAEAREAANEVFYQTFASHEDRRLVFAPLQFSWDIIKSCPNVGGDNDGLVPRASQLWQAALKASNGVTKCIVQRELPFSADHLNQVGWCDPNQLLDMPLFRSNPFKFLVDYEHRVKEFYAGIATGLRQL